MMTIESVARRFDHRAGYELIDYAEVALPLYRITIDAVTMEHQKIPPFKEFVMRSIDAGFGHDTEIAKFLGLDDLTVGATVSNLIDERYIGYEQDGASLKLTDRGVKVLAEAGELKPQDETLVFLYDRLLRRPVWLSPSSILTPNEIDRQRVIEIRPYPAEGPQTSDLKYPEVAKALLRQAGGKVALNKNLLAIKEIERRARRYRLAVAIVYKKIRSSDIQIAFVVDDARNEELEHAFSEGGGPKKMGFVGAIGESSTAVALRRHLGPDIQELLPDPKNFEKKLVKFSALKLKQQIASQQLIRAVERGRDDRAEKKSLAEVERNLKAADEEISDSPARALAPYEVEEFVDRTFSSSQFLMAFSSRDISPHILDQTRMKLLEAALKRGVRVFITLSQNLEIDRSKGEKRNLILELEKLRARFNNLDFRFETRRGFHFIIKDDEFAVVLNRPSLGNSAKVRTFGHFVGYLLQRSDLVNAYRQRAVPNAATKN